MSDYLYGTTNYTGPGISDGHYQNSVEFGKTVPSSELDSLSRLHDSAYARWTDRSYRAAADEIYSYTAKHIGILPALIAGQLVDSVNYLTNIGYNPDYNSVSYALVLAEVLDYYSTDPKFYDSRYQPFVVQYANQVYRKEVGEYIDKMNIRKINLDVKQTHVVQPESDGNGILIDEFAKVYQPKTQEPITKTVKSTPISTTTDESGTYNPESVSKTTVFKQTSPEVTTMGHDNVTPLSTSADACCNSAPKMPNTYDPNGRNGMFRKVNYKKNKKFKKLKNKIYLL